ncbi:hypothetical protein PZ938_00075 [Luteipulveratus sp. YIM 133132]|uniref:hypothetical protein n=1 Tax=Luteipulveratus flavus TaxID=3031728 RepID=UPI0023B1FCEF|nr:hypothetical protein [Luteipulveratus sp. YIM 133132]MDE9363990.1 hypothetical protein [Luteipulveratus sp. YIM 133132]
MHRGIADEPSGLVGEGGEELELGAAVALAEGMRGVQGVVQARERLGGTLVEQVVGPGAFGSRWCSATPRVCTLVPTPIVPWS